jgi:uncharacterized protein (TIGR02246 family)
MLRVLMVLWGCALGAGVVSAQTAATNTAEEKAVREVVQRYVDARDRRDAAALAQLFTADADQFTTSGEWRRGRDGIVKGGLASSQQNPGSRTITVESVRFIARDVAIADGPYAIRGADPATTRPMWTTIVVTRTPEGWRIAAIRNALPTATVR